MKSFTVSKSILRNDLSAIYLKSNSLREISLLPSNISCIKSDKNLNNSNNAIVTQNVSNSINNYMVYLLINSNCNNTYIGITNNSLKRLRQHNGEIKGGAKYTAKYSKSGSWSYYGYIENLNKSIALSIEKKIQKRSKRTTGKTPLQRRLNCIDTLLSKEYHELVFTKK